MEMDALLQKLNPHQRQAVLDGGRALLLKANVGSGKTTVLIVKALYEHVRGGVPLRDMVVLTFTNKAADEIRSRMRAADPQAGEGDMPWFGTFHSVAMKLLQTRLPVEELGYTPAFSVLDPDELVELANRLITEHRLTIKYRAKLAKRLEACRAGQALYGVMKQADDLGRLCGLIADEKRRQNKMDFDDLLDNVALLLKKGDWSPRWIIIDEFQDCDEAQLALIRAMASEDTRLFAVGDPNQVIYSWRGGGSDVFRRFKQDYQAKELSLPLNYRSSSTILEAARCFLEDHSELSGVRQPGSGILVRSLYSPFLEADYLADKILGLHEAGVPWQEMAVFYRLQRQSGILEDVFSRRKIPFAVSARKTLRDIPVLQWLLRLLNAGVHETDRNSLLSVLTDKAFGEGFTEARAKKVLETGSGSPLYAKIRGFSAWAADCTDAQAIYGYFGLDSRLSPTSASFAENNAYVRAFLDRLADYQDDGALDFLHRLADFLNASVLYGTDFVDVSSAPADAVRLMTLHACKGLEFRHVFIIGVNDGLIPLRNDSGRAKDMDEEKRLFFVGITRAKDTLELSYYTNPDHPRILPGESCFITMLPPHLLDGGDAAAPATADLQAYRRMVLENRGRGAADIFGAPESAEASVPAPPANAARKARHPKYRDGFIEAEDDDTVTVVFEGYGAKTFSKDFCPLEFRPPE